MKSERPVSSLSDENQTSQDNENFEELDDTKSKQNLDRCILLNHQ